jgi:flagellar biosynthesis/type III secretory pathway protein FliH
VAFPSLKEIHSSFQLLRAIPSDGVHLQPNILRLDFIELPKISSLKPEQNPLFSAWVQFLSAKSVEDIEDAAHCVPEIKQLVGELRKMSAEKKFINLLNKNEVDRVIAQRAQAEALRDAKAEGRAEGEEQGRRQAMLSAVAAVLIEKDLVTEAEFNRRLQGATLEQLKSLLVLALKFTSPDDLETWEKEHLS